MNKIGLWTVICLLILGQAFALLKMQQQEAQINDLYKANIQEVKDMQTLQTEVKYWNDTQSEVLLQVNDVTELMQTVQSGIVNRQKLNNL